MAIGWITLPSAWKLQDVQAALNVIIQFLCGFAVFVFARVCWGYGTVSVVKHRNVSLSALLSINTIGEALDVLLLLQQKVFSEDHRKVIAQCFVVFCLTATAFLSGPIARYSTRRIDDVRLQEVPGYLATNDHSSMAFANVQWNATEESLNRANFSTDQLLDFMPDTSIPFVYVADQWNSSWSLDCKPTNVTAVQLKVGNNCTSFYSEVIGLDAIINRDDYEYLYRDWDGFYANYTTLKDVLLILMGINYGNANNTPTDAHSMDFALAAVHMHHLGNQINSSSPCSFSPGPVGSASYTKITCHLSRLDHLPDEHYVAYPNTANILATAEAYIQYYTARLIQESTSDSPITMIPPQELTRFYQVYLAAKDTQYRLPVTRRLSVQLRVVQLSAVFLALCLLLALLCFLGAAQYALFWVMHRRIVRSTPQSKLDWMMQSIYRGRGSHSSDGQSAPLCHASPWA